MTWLRERRSLELVEHRLDVLLELRLDMLMGLPLQEDEREGLRDRLLGRIGERDTLRVRECERRELSPYEGAPPLLALRYAKYCRNRRSSSGSLFTIDCDIRLARNHRWKFSS